MTRVANFNAGPAALPLPVLERARDEMIDFQGTGMSIMEHSHRGKAYDGVHNEALSLLRELTGLPDSHDILFLQGGASQQFAMVPMNFLAGGSADYVDTGHWSARAIDEARFYGTARIAAAAGVLRVPRQDELDLDPGARYLHVTTNNTIEGSQQHGFLDGGAVPLVADMSSDFMWTKRDLSPYALIYAGAQKNLGPSGVTLVIIRKDFAAAGRTDIPKVFRYSTFAANNSLYNTPPTFAIYLMRNMLSWIKSVGGVAQIAAWNDEKARLLYAAIDGSDGFYKCPVEVGSRSSMNVVFRLPSEALDEQFVKESTKAGLIGLKGYRTVGGMRASLYNAVTVENVQTLCAFMREFAGKAR